MMEFNANDYSDHEGSLARLTHEVEHVGFTEEGSFEYSPPLDVPAEYSEVRAVLADGGDRFGVSAVAFDAQEELLWMGNQGGHVTSYYSTGMQKYTSFQIHATNEVRQILTFDAGILALTRNYLRCQIRRGIPLFTHSTESMQELQCMMLTPENTLLMGGHQHHLIEFDLDRVEEIRQVDVGEHGCAIIRQHQKYLCTGDISGKVTLRDPKTLNSEHVFSAHNGTLSDFDVHGNLLITSGFSKRLGNLAVDRFLMVYDLRMLRSVAPIQLLLDPLLLRFVPTYAARLAVVSQSGQFQFVEEGTLTASSMCLYHMNCVGSMCLTFDVSSNCESLAFGDSGGYIHLFSRNSETNFNAFSRATEFADPVEPIPPININDEITPLSTVPMPFCSGKLLSDWPAEFCKVIYRPTPKIDPAILNSMKMNQNIGYAPNFGNRRRNQVPYKDEKKKHRDDAVAFRVPKRYRKVELKYSKLGLEDFDFDHYNKTSFAGLEASLSNSYCNAILQVLYFIEPLRCALLSHWCQNEFCMTCELGFLFKMLDSSRGMPCQASNFLRAFRTIREASALGLVLSDADDSKKKSKLTRLIQSWNRFILQQLHSEIVEYGGDDLDELDNVSAESFDSLHHSLLSRLFGTELFTSNRCQCSEETCVDSTTLLFSLMYPDCNPPASVKQYSFVDVLSRSMCLEKKTQAWCEKCEKYQPTIQSRRLKNLPDVLSINCGLDIPQHLNFWRVQMEMLTSTDKDNDILSGSSSSMSSSTSSSTKPCRYGTTCNNKDCKFLHPWNTSRAASQGERPLPLVSWLPLGVILKLCPDGRLDVEEAQQPEKVDANSLHGGQVYQLMAVVSHIKDCRASKKDGIVACIKAGPNYHERAMGSPVSQWYLFNDFTITPIAAEEATWFQLDWKVPCVLYFACMDLNEKHSLTPINPISAEVFKEDKSLALRGGRQCMTFTPLGLDEMLKSGDVVAMDAEFVTLNQEEAEIRSDGTLSTIKPSQLLVARITCVRGQGPLESTPFIDDYISTQEQVVDYVTKFSGIKPGDLDASISSKHLTTLKSTYLKLQYLIDCGVVFLGHGLKNDFRVINLVIPSEQVIDTLLLFHLPHQRFISLRFLAWHFLGLKIQSVTHDSTEDAQTALKLYHRYQQFERDNKVKEKLQELYENGRNLQWKVSERVD